MDERPVAAEAEERLEESGRAIRQLVHDARSPLSVVRMDLWTLRDLLADLRSAPKDPRQAAETFDEIADLFDSIEQAAGLAEEKLKALYALGQELTETAEEVP